MQDYTVSQKTVETSIAKMAYVEMGTGFPAVFIHGLGQSSYFWRHQLSELSHKQRCISVDLMAHGHTETDADQDVSFIKQADMILEALSELGIDTFDLVLNDSGGAIGQIMAVKAPERVRSMVLTNCDVHDNWPPIALNQMRDAARAGLFADQISTFLDHPELFRMPGSIGEMVYEDPAMATDETIKINLSPIISSQARKDIFNRYVGMQDHSQLVNIEDSLRRLKMPCLIVWGTEDIFFDVKWAHWLKHAFCGAQDVIEIEGAKLFFPEERPSELNPHILRFWGRLT